jgi:hypothetical protein
MRDVGAVTPGMCVSTGRRNQPRRSERQSAAKWPPPSGLRGAGATKLVGLHNSWLGTFGNWDEKDGDKIGNSQQTTPSYSFVECCAQHVAGLGVFWRQALVSFLPSLQIPSIFQFLLELNMSGTNILPGAHDFVVSGTINAARNVRKSVRYS